MRITNSISILLLVSWARTAEVLSALNVYEPYLRQETLAEDVLLEQDGQPWDRCEMIKINGIDLTLAVRRHRSS